MTARGRSAARRRQGALRSATALAAIALGLGCASPVPYYGGSPVVLPHATEGHRAALVQGLVENAKANGIAAVHLVDGSQGRRVFRVEAGPAELEDWPIPALEALAYAAEANARGAEVDLAVRRADGAPGVVVTVRHELDRTLVVLPGVAPIPLDGPAPTSDDLTQRFGIGPLLDAPVPWKDSERRALEVALGLLSAEERAYLRDIPFRREAGSAADSHAGFYRVDDRTKTGEILLLDRAFAMDGMSFVATPAGAYPMSIAVLLHEMGHAVAKLDRQRLLQIYERDSLAYNEAVPVANEFVGALNERYKLVNRLDPAQKRRMQRDIRLLERKHRKNMSLMRDARRRLDSIREQIESPSPMESAYGALPNAKRGPTEYARTHVEEAFAEAFALYHLDPESIRRFSPEVHDWFATGQHLSSSRYPPLEPVRRPSDSEAPGE